MTWFYLTILAVIFQVQRNLLQKNLRSKLSTVEASWARVFFVLPLLLIVLAYLVTIRRDFFVNIDPIFYLYCFGTGIAQILATLCLVELFSRKNFSIGVSYTKTDTIQTAILASIFLSESLPAMGIFAVIMAFVGVVLLNSVDYSKGGLLKKVFHKNALLGLGSGFFLSITTIFMKKATLMVNTQQGDKVLSVIIVFIIYIGMQNIAYIFYESYKNRLSETVSNMLSQWKKVSLVSFFSMLGTMCWIGAFLLQKVAYVKLVAQIEVLISLIISHKLLKEKNLKGEVVGMFLLVASVALVLFVK
mgnify:CR=1 FL=1